MFIHTLPPRPTTPASVKQKAAFTDGGSFVSLPDKCFLPAEVMPTPPHPSKAIPKAQVAPMLRSQSNGELDPHSEESPSGEYIYPDDHRPPKPRLDLGD